MVQLTSVLSQKPQNQPDLSLVMRLLYIPQVIRLRITPVTQHAAWMYLLLMEKL